MNEPTTPSPKGDDGPAVEIPEYELIRPIGEGGFGRVWLARNRTTGLLRALKLVPLARSGGADPAGREIMSLTRLEANLRHQHADLLTIYHVGKTAHHLYYVMDLADDVSGAPATSAPDYRPASLESRLDAGPLEPDECLRYTGQLLSGLVSLHEAGMVHRDVKPSNCLLVGGELKLADFGLLTEVSPQISRVGTQKYMPPDGRMDMRADVYAAGLVIYEMVTGLPPESFPRLADRAGQVAETPALCTLVRLALGACQPDPQQRFPNAGVMQCELVSEPESAAQPGRQRRRVTVAIAGLTVVVALAAVLLLPREPDRVHVNIITEGPLFEATVFLDGEQVLHPDGTPVRTPCTVDDLPARAHHVVLKHEQLPDHDLGEIDFDETRQIVVRWDGAP
ncbi:MAG: serine/threonine protein kinase [Planctomycetes bacterium]|nr:serine/threonine protein kinase [Planctomycetota bacterium]